MARSDNTSTKAFGSSPVRTANISVMLVTVIILIKVAIGFSTGSLAVFSEALHSATDLVAALMTVFAVKLAQKPPDRSHAYGHGKAEHLAALAEALLLVGAAIYIMVEAVHRLTGTHEITITAPWWAFAGLIAVLIIDALRFRTSLRGARQFNSAAFRANAAHFASDFIGTFVVFIGFVAVRAGYQDVDSWAALVVSVLVLLAGGSLIRSNINVLMDRVPENAEQIARHAILTSVPDAHLRSMRMRTAGSTYFVDVIIEVPGDVAVAAGHTIADQVEAAIYGKLPGADVLVHVEPEMVHSDGLRERIMHSAMAVPGVQEIHNLRLVMTKSSTELSLHFKLPPDTRLDAAHETSQQLESAIIDAAPELDVVITHMEPLEDKARAVTVSDTDSAHIEQTINDVVFEQSGEEKAAVKIVRTQHGLIIYTVLKLSNELTVAEAHRIASDVEREIKSRLNLTVLDVVAHTEPLD